MDVFTLAAEILGDVRLTSGQLGQLRALEYRLLVESLRETAPPARTQLVNEILVLLTPDQGGALTIHGSTLS